MHSIGQLTNTRRSDVAPEPDGPLRAVVRTKILHDHQLYIDRPEPIVFMSVAFDTSDRIYDDFFRLLFRQDQREHRLFLTKFRRKRVNFVFFVLIVYLILRGQWG